MATREEVIKILETIDYPEIHLDVWTMGLIYNLEVTNENVDIKMTFTTPLCPYGPELVEEIKRRIKEDVKGIKKVNVEIVMEPKWKPSEELRAILGV